MAYRSRYELQANLHMESSAHYNQLKEKENCIEEKFKNNLGELIWEDERNRIGFSRNTVHVDRANTDQEFSWLHERLMKLHEVFQPRVLKLQR